MNKLPSKERVKRILWALTAVVFGLLMARLLWPLPPGEEAGSRVEIDGNNYTVYSDQLMVNYSKPNDEQLQQQLTALQYQVTQQDGTERSFNNEYYKHYEKGIYVDIVSGEPLYSSRDKYNSNTGWPAFTQAISGSAVTEHTDYKLIYPRTEVRSAVADSHLGHIFTDGPPEAGGLRHCINSAALQFIPKADMEQLGYGDYLSQL